ncbi:MAG: hypothetical protein J2P57_23770 [Acidimicrobiaceae bacterium]|nr:hypothetical protein [Acidimicrobiaceae bacterium]
MNWEDCASSTRLVVALAEMNADLRSNGAEPLISVASAQGMLEVGDIAGLRRAVTATAAHLGRLISAIGDT